MPFDSSRTPDIFRIQLDTFFSLSLLFSSLFNSTSERVVDAKERERFRGKEMIRHEDNQDLTDYEGWSIPSGSVGSSDHCRSCQTNEDDDSTLFFVRRSSHSSSLLG